MFHVIILCNIERELSPQDCVNELKFFGNQVPPHIATVCRWFNEFNRDRNYKFRVEF